jgi:hypothetical protein
MADEPRHTLGEIARHLILAATPLIEAGRSRGAFMRLMSRLGYHVADIPGPYGALATQVSEAVEEFEALSASPDLEDLLHLLERAKGVFDAVQGLGSAPAPTGVDAAAYAAEIGERLFELLLTDYLMREQPGAYNLLSMLNVIVVESIPATPTRPNYVRTHFRWSEIPEVLRDPQGLPGRVYRWGAADFNDRLLLNHLAVLAHLCNLPVSFRRPGSRELMGYLGLERADPEPSGRSLVLPFFYGNINGDTVEASLALQRLPPQNGQMPGLIIEPRLPSAMPLEFALGQSTQMKVRSGTNLDELFGITIRPPAEIGVRYPLAPGTPPPAAGVGLDVAFTPPEPVVLLGDPAASHIELASLSAGLAVEVTGPSVSIGFNADLHGLRIVIAAEEGDNFLRTIIGDDPVAIDVPLGMEWRESTGIRFKGSAAFEVTLHPHLHLGSIRIDEATVRLSAGQDAPAISLKVTAGISGSLGPIQFTLMGTGLRTDAVFEPGNAGPFDIRLGFKPPDGAGLAIDAGGFVGGGFLLFDSEKGEYSGGLELVFKEQFAIRALGIITTKMPDGTRGFALLLLITSDIPPIALPFGFMLRAVGGLLALNRTANREALRTGVRDGTLDSVLFPKDIVANAPRILGDLQRVFPIQRGLFLVGPMALLTWGAPPLITIKVGIIIELPRFGLAILGVVRVVLPTEDTAVLRLQVNFVGTVDFEAGQLQFDASLFESRVLNFTLAGDMAVRFYWKANANLLLTAGGFNPAYTPPPMNLPQLRRMSIVLFQGNPDVRAEMYLAVTSNTLQFGGRLDLAFRFSIFKVAGFVSLDVLITRSPFHFTAEVAGMVAISAGGHSLFSIRLQLTLDGPRPMRARGTGSFEIGFVFTVTISVKFDVTFGDPLTLLLPVVDVLGELARAVSDLANWTPRLPAASHQSVTLRALAVGDRALVLHPFGFLDISQKIVPLGVPIQRFGALVPERGNVFGIADVTLAGSIAPTTPRREEFAPAQFFELTDAEKLSRPSFEDLEAGLAVGGDPLPRSDWMRHREVSYEVIYLPEQHPVRPRFAMPVNLAGFSLAGAAVTQSTLSRARTGASALSESVRVQRDRYAVVSTEDLSLHHTELVFDTAAAAKVALASLLQQSPDLTGSIQVLPTAVLGSIEVPA